MARGIEVAARREHNLAAACGSSGKPACRTIRLWSPSTTMVLVYFMRGKVGKNDRESDGPLIVSQAPPQRLANAVRVRLMQQGITLSRIVALAELRVRLPWHNIDHCLEA
jgi:hypothetical protein